MFLAEEAAKAASKIGTFDWFMLAFTVLIAIGFVRLLTARPKKNIFAIGFTAVSLGLFLLIDFIMITKVWMA
ncbi:hypothetical protein FHS16_006414 [Paenibacillus endophyticus]|uniref:DUF2759 family protein n=1 Tax=Paenibacillus endophyticus TaxID=1294268 RepID=A0A7W5CEM6_9BACL|nr:hypothetical protein [Paenibacillus endophyticus]MBB3156291.1 hypothetical protein [Paenibacillus endophyticus]